MKFKQFGILAVATIGVLAVLVLAGFLFERPCTCGPANAAEGENKSRGEFK